MTISQSELHGLFPRFAAPLVNGETAKRFGEPVARQLARTFWRMMIDGPKSEAYLWKSFGPSFTSDDVAMLRRCFYEASATRSDVRCMPLFGSDQANLDGILVESIGADVLFIRPYDGPIQDTDSSKITEVLQLPEHSKTEQGCAVKNANRAVRKRDLQLIIVFWHNRLDSRIHGHLSGSILNGFCPLTASSQSAINSS